MNTALDHIDYVPNFTAREFPAGALENTDMRVLKQLQKLRNAWGRSIHPARDPAGWARFSGSETGRHYAVNRLSDAGDFFPEGNVFEAWLLMPKFFTGIGLYFDTNRYNLQPGPMLHGDVRDGPHVFWFRHEGIYYLLNGDPKNQMELCHAIIEYLRNEVKRDDI